MFVSGVLMIAMPLFPLVTVPAGIWLGALYAGLFYGDVKINGNLTASTKSFKIDHPLDPSNKYLNHSSVESPDMKNVYDGVVVLDDKGEAVVVLAAWFEALNKDFRYQLTPIGAPGPNLHIAKEIENQRFKIAGGSSRYESLLASNWYTPRRFRASKSTSGRARQISK